MVSIVPISVRVAVMVAVAAEAARVQLYWVTFRLIIQPPPDMVVCRDL
jgi:hypothetical protein